ncbi:MAG: HAD-IIA family hydrolase [Lachnospiraceae bacterium]
MKKNFLKDSKVFLFDLDGTIYCGNKAMPDAAKLINVLKSHGYIVKFVSNNSSHTVDFLCEKLEKMGIESEKDSIVTPLSTVGKFINNYFGKSEVFVLGTEALKNSISKSGHSVINGGETCDVVVIGRDIEITYKKIEQAGIFLQKGASCIVCNNDNTHPGELGYLVPETGAFFNMVKTVCIPNICREIGKPDPFLYIYAMDGVSPETCVMIGDNVDTDILGAKRANCKTVLLEGPLSIGREDCADLHIKSLSDILPYLE